MRCLIGRFMSARQCSRTVSDARRHQVAGRRQLLAADHVLVVDAGQVDGRPLAAVDFLDGLVVVLQRADAHALAARQPFHLVADAARCRT